MKMKKIVFGLLLAMPLSVGVATLAKPNKSAAVAEAASTTRLYLDMSGFADWYSSSASFKLHTWNTAKGDQYHAVTKVANAYYYADVDLATYSSGDGGYKFIRYNSTGSVKWNEGAWRSYDSANIQTYYRASGWTSGSWTKDDQKTWTVVGATNGKWEGGDEDISISLEMRFNDEGLSFYNTSVELTAGSVFKVKNSDNSYYGYDCIETGAGSVIAAGDVSGSGSSNITVVNSGSYEVYMKPFAAKFWMQENSEATATNWASSFLTDTNSICTTGGTSADHLAALQAVWGGIVDSFNSLTLGARTIIKTGTANATVKDAHDRYEHIMSRYPSLTAFDDWSVAAAPSVVFNNPTNSDNSIIIITIISVVSISSICALLIIKKRKVNH